jgi:hypothetical protein
MYLTVVNLLVQHVRALVVDGHPVARGAVRLGIHRLQDLGQELPPHTSRQLTSLHLTLYTLMHTSTRSR